MRRERGWTRILSLAAPAAVLPGTAAASGQSFAFFPRRMDYGYFL